MGADIDSPDLLALKRGVFWQAAFKLDWAEDLFNTAAHHLSEYLCNGGAGIGERFDEATGEYVMEIFSHRLPRQIPLAIGSGIHSLRSALDTAVTEIVIQAGGNPGMRTNFPVHKTEENLRAEFEPSVRKCPDCKKERTIKAPKGQIAKLAPDLVKMLFEVFRPWENGNYPLWALSKLDNAQKHEMLLAVMTTTIGKIDFNTVEGMNAKGNVWQIGLDQTLELARSRHRIVVTNSPAISCVLVFPHGVPFAGEPVFEVLEQLYKLVRGILITLQAHFEG